jgi:4-hydroxy-4-methyl-2-oxoglutarate aldolase
MIGGVRIEAGDLIVADRTGTVVVPFELLDHVIATVERVGGLEAEMDAKVAGGQKVPQAISDLLETEKVKWL